MKHPIFLCVFRGVHWIFFIRMPRFQWVSRFLSKQRFWALNVFYIIISCFLKWALVLSWKYTTGNTKLLINHMVDLIAPYYSNNSSQSMTFKAHSLFFKNQKILSWGWLGMGFPEFLVNNPKLEIIVGIWNDIFQPFFSTPKSFLCRIMNMKFIIVHGWAAMMITCYRNRHSFNLPAAKLYCLLLRLWFSK